MMNFGSLLTHKKRGAGILELILSNPATAAAIARTVHGLVGAAALAGSAYGIKKLVDGKK